MYTDLIETYRSIDIIINLLKYFLRTVVYVPVHYRYIYIYQHYVRSYVPVLYIYNIWCMSLNNLLRKCLLLVDGGEEEEEEEEED